MQKMRKIKARFLKRKKERKKKENVFALMGIYKIVELPVGVNECDHIRKLLNKNYIGKVPSKAAKC